jgi:hypothetical protein
MNEKRDLVCEVFDRMDEWRHLPSYQLERRADLFFSLYLPEVLTKKLGFEVKEQVVPEFPIRIGTIKEEGNKLGKGKDNQSFRIDYLAMSADGNKAIFVELKTDEQSRNERQDEYLRELIKLKESKKGLKELLEGVREILGATKPRLRPKYFCLLKHLESVGLLERTRDDMTGLGIRQVKGSVQPTVQANECGECLIVYVQPKSDRVPESDGATVICFDEFRKVVASHQDPLSQRFAESLVKWATVPPGCPPGRIGTKFLMNRADLSVRDVETLTQLGEPEPVWKK